MAVRKRGKVIFEGGKIIKRPGKVQDVAKLRVGKELRLR